jgi:transcriptional regulator with GAF, ATPase, and Fis domain
VRLLDALRHRTEELGQSVGELRALGEVSQAVNSTLDLETVLSTIVTKAVQLSGTEAGAIYVFDENEFHLRATYGMDQELIDALTQRHVGLDDRNVAQALAQPEPIQVADLREDATTDINEITLRAGYRALGGATLSWKRCRWPAGGSSPHAWRLPAEHGRFDQDFRGSIGGGDRERALIPKR